MRTKLTLRVAAAILLMAPSAYAGAVLSGMDPLVKPGEDFYSYANGGWMRSTEIPADRGKYGIFAELSELNQTRLASLIQQLPRAGAAADRNTRKIADYYTSFMDEAGIESRGIDVLRPTFARIASIRDRHALADYLGSTLRADVDVLNATSLHTDNVFGLWVAQDLDAPERYSPFLLQGGLGMPDRDYYLSASASMQDIRVKYRAHIATVLRSLGDADAAHDADQVFDLERRLAEVHVSRTETEDVKRGNNHWSRQQFSTLAPGIFWQDFFKAASLDSQAGFVMWQPAAVTGIAALVASQPLEVWKIYLKFHAVEHNADYLPSAYVAENFDFYEHILEGTPQMRERWKRAIGATNAALGEAVGQLYVQRYFPPEAKARIETLVQHLIVAFNDRIDALGWLAPSTKVEAKAKLATLKVGVGYPDHWRDYSSLRISAGDAFGNQMRAQLFDYHRNLAKLGKPVDRSEWVMVPQVINAVNLPALNALNFPAGILQPPFFDLTRPDAVNYGAIGAVIGHEISHSFDDQGALFDAHGRLHNWWTAADLDHFHAASKQLIEQFDHYRPFPDLAVNGAQNLSENIADLGGLVIAHRAFGDSLAGAAAPVVDGLTGEQQFFVSFAQSWRTKAREASLREEIATDGHSPGQYRALTVRNDDDWYRAFDVKAADPEYLAPDSRVRIW